MSFIPDKGIKKDVLGKYPLPSNSPRYHEIGSIDGDLSGGGGEEYPRKDCYLKRQITIKSPQ